MTNQGKSASRLSHPDKEMGVINVAHTIEVYPGCHIGTDLLFIDNFADIPLPTEPRRMQSLLLALCTEGKVSYSIDEEEHVACANNMIIVGEGQVTTNGRVSSDCRGIGVMISYEFFNEAIKDVGDVASLFLFARSHPVHTISEQASQSIQRHYWDLRAKAEDTTHRFRREMVQALFQAMIYDICNIIYKVHHDDGRNHSRPEELLTNFIRLVEHHFSRERRVGWYAEQLGISAKYLSETVKTLSRRSPSDWIDYYVTKEIRVMLKNSSYSMKEIAERMNFSNQSFMAQYFKERVGMTPTQYRRS